MPSTKENAKALADAKARNALTPAQGSPSAGTPPPIQPNIPGKSPLLRSPLPTSMVTQPDSLRDWYNSATPQNRVAPLPPLASVGGNASAASQATKIANPIFTVAANAATTANDASSTAVAASATAVAASATAAVAATGVTTINSSTAVALVSGVLQQVPISTLDAITATPSQDNLNDGITFGRVVNLALTSNKIDTTKSGVLATGGCFPSQIVGTSASIFSFTASAPGGVGSVVVSLTSFTVFFADGTNTVIGSGSMTTGSLAASTTYYFYPFPTSALAVNFAVVSGGVGSPSANFYTPQSPTAAQVMNGQSVTALATSGIQAITPASGGSGGGHGGGSGISLRAGQHIESQSRGVIKIEDVEVGEFIRGRHDWVEVLIKKIIPHDHFVRVTLSSGESASFTPTHATTAIRDGEEMSIAAGKLSISDFLIVRDGYAAIKNIEHLEEPSVKVSLTVTGTHEFYVSESESVSILSHNAIPIS
jgi:hypothetical protein